MAQYTVKFNTENNPKVLQIETFTYICSIA